VKGATVGPSGIGDPEDISIHAPVKGATGISLEPLVIAKISIHAPVKGATYQRAVYHARRGISIHAPVKGATGARRSQR